MQETPVRFLGQEDPLEKGLATHSTILGLPCGSAGKESACNAGDLGSIPELGRYPGERKGYPLQYSGLENSMDRIAWQVIVHGVAKNWTYLSMCHCHSSKEQASFNLVAAVTIYSDFEAEENKICHCFHFPPFYLP